MRTAIVAMVLVISTAAHAGIRLPKPRPPYPQAEIFPHSDKAMANALTDSRLSDETKQQLLALFESRLYPQLIRNPKTGATWVYRLNHAPELLDKGGVTQTRE